MKKSHPKSSQKKSWKKVTQKVAKKKLEKSHPKSRQKKVEKVTQKVGGPKAPDGPKARLGYVGLGCWLCLLTFDIFVLRPKKKKTPSTVSTKGPTKRCSFAASQLHDNDPLPNV